MQYYETLNWNVCHICAGHRCELHIVALYSPDASCFAELSADILGTLGDNVELITNNKM